MEKFYVTQGTRQLGPFSSKQLKDFYLGHQLPEDSFVYSEHLDMQTDIHSFVKDIIESENITPPPIPAPQLETQNKLELRQKRVRRFKVRKLNGYMPANISKKKQKELLTMGRDILVISLVMWASSRIYKSVTKSDAIVAVATLESKATPEKITEKIVVEAKKVAVAPVLEKKVVPVVKTKVDAKSKKTAVKAKTKKTAVKAKTKTNKKVVAKRIIDSNFKLKFDRERKSLVLTTTSKYEGEVEFRLISVPKKILQMSHVELFGKGELKDGELKISDYTFERGSRIIDGYYNVFIRGDKTLSFMEEINNDVKSVNQEGEKFISLMSRVAFRRKLNKLYKKVSVNEDRYWSELQQKYLTVKMITVNIRKEVEKIFDTSKNKTFERSVKDFEKAYTGNYGKFFTSFVISNEASYSGLKRKSFNNKNRIISSYSKLTRLSKQIGTSTMDILHNLELSSGKQTAQLKKESLKPLDNIINQMDSMIKTLQ